MTQKLNISAESCPALETASRLLITEASTVTISQLIAFIMNLLNHMFISFVTIYLSWLCLKLKLKKTATHALLCTLGFAFLLAEGVMTRYQGNALTFFYSPKDKATIHWILQSLGGILGIAGTIQKVVGKETHFKSLHAKFGLAACIFCFVNMIIGLGALYYDELRLFSSPFIGGTIHNLLGLTTFVLGMIAQFYGYETGFFRRNSTEEIQNLFKILTVVTLGLTAIAPFKSLLYRCLNLY